MKQNIQLHTAWAACLLAFGLTACQPDKKQQDTTANNGLLKTESIAWEEKESTEGCKLSIDYPAENGNALSQNIREWINEQLGGTYNGDLNDGKKLMEYYGKARAEQIRKDIAELGENTAMGQSCYYVQLKKLFETKLFITYTNEVYEYAGGAHGSESLTGAVFRKVDGRKFGWDMFTENGKEKLRGMIKQALQKRYFKTDNEKEFYDMLLVDNADVLFPLPATPPICRAQGVQFTYQQYEIAPYAAGSPTCTIPYDSLTTAFTTTMRTLAASVTDSLGQATAYGYQQ